jgi:hypothetical protein
VWFLNCPSPWIRPAPCCSASALRAEDFQGSTHALPYDEPVINYSGRTPADPVALLQQRLAGGETALAWDERFGYLPALLDALHVPKSSQMLVFSKTSLQRSHISPENPRALFYNDDVYIGYIPGAPVMEVSAVDPQLGAVFYTLEQEKARPAQFTRSSDCLSCHAAGRSLGVPGHILRSIATDRRGEIDTQNERSPVDPTMPLSDRWAGWYVTGQHGAQTHLGNLIGESAFARQLKEPNHAGNVAELSGFIEADKYPAATSDITALMMLEHQAHMQNYITRLHYEAQLMLAMYGHVRYLKNQVNAFLRCLLFTEEAPLLEPVVGNSEFARQFVSSGPRDHRGRSLRDLDLKTRMFRYPCSYLIYSAAFDALPDEIREVLLGRLYDILTGKETDAQFAGIAEEDRTAILEILRETKQGLPGYWRG